MADGRQQSLVGFDTETWLIVPSQQAPPLVCVSVCAGAAVSVLAKAKGLQWVREVFANPKFLIVGHNVGFDLCALLAADFSLGPILFQAVAEGRVRDTMLREQMLANATGKRHYMPDVKLMHGTVGAYSLAACVFRHFNIDISEGKIEGSWRLRYKELDGVPIEEWPFEARAYAESDALYARDLYLKQKEVGEQMAVQINATVANRWVRSHVDINKRPKETPVGPVVVRDFFADEPAQVRAAFALRLMECWGMRTDAAAVMALEAYCKAEIEAVVPDLLKAGLKRTKKDGTPGSMDMKALQIRIEAAYTKMNRTALQTPKRGTSTSAEVLLASKDELLVRFGESSLSRKILSTYVPALKDGVITPVHPSFSVLMETGRTSCHEPNLQNPPRKGGVRDCFIPRPGWLFATSDYDTAELRSLAQACLDLVGHSTLADRYNADPNFDPHTLLASDLMHISYEEALVLKKANDKTLKHRRQYAKSCFHPDTEVLTRNGWKRIADLVLGEEVMAATPVANGVTMQWEVPLQLTERESPVGELVHLRNKGIDLRVTPDHRMLAFNASGQAKVVEPEDLEVCRTWVNAGEGPVEGVEVNEFLLRLAVATQADGNYQNLTIRLGFTKQRKIDRMEVLLRGVDGEWDRSITSQGATMFVVRSELVTRIRALLDPNKQLPLWWIGLSRRCRDIVLDEFKHWDGSFAGTRNHGDGNPWTMSQYYSCDPQNVDVFQALAAMSGRKTRAAVSNHAAEKHRTCWKVSVRDHAHTRGESLETLRIPYTGKVVCLSVPSTFVLVRDGGIPVVVGQCNFGFPGGLGARKFVSYAHDSGIDIDEDEAKSLREAWFMRWPEMKDYFAAINLLCGGKGGFGSSGTILQYRSERIRGDVRYTACCNGFFQSSVADGAKFACFLVAWECYAKPTSPLYGCRPVLFMHDEILIEAPEGRAHEAAVRLGEVMVEALECFLPDVPVTASPALMRRWYKGAEAVFDVNGRLVPWEPKVEEKRVA